MMNSVPGISVFSSLGWTSFLRRLQWTVRIIFPMMPCFIRPYSRLFPTELWNFFWRRGTGATGIVSIQCTVLTVPPVFPSVFIPMRCSLTGISAGSQKKIWTLMLNLPPSRQMNGMWLYVKSFSGLVIRRRITMPGPIMRGFSVMG